MATAVATPVEHLPPPYLLPSETSAAPAPAPQQAGDPETASILSQAPSYTSHTTELPTYDSIQPIGLPRLRYAPGFTPTTNDPFSAANYTNSSSAERRHPARRQYENVVNRWAEEGRRGLELLGAAPTSPGALPAGQLASVNEENTEGEDTGRDAENRVVSEEEFKPMRFVNPSLPRGAGTQTANSNRDMLLGYCPHVAPSTSVPTSVTSACASGSNGANPFPAARSLPANPHEDPELVGQEAAERARSQRLYREILMREMAAQQALVAQQEAAMFQGMIGPLSARGPFQRERAGSFNGRPGGMGGGWGNLHSGRSQVGGRRGLFRRWSRA